MRFDLYPLRHPLLLAQDLLMRWQRYLRHHSFYAAQARACSDADLRYYASGNGLLSDDARRHMRREAKRRRLSSPH